MSKALAVMLNPRFFPTCMVVLSLLAAVVWWHAGSRRWTFYYLFAAGLTWAATYLPE
jgi:hypothetical protein